MSRKRESLYLSNKERLRFDALAESMTVRDAAQKLGISEGTLNNWTYKLRKRLIKERGHLNACLAQMKRAKLIKKVMSRKTPIKNVEEESKDWEEEEDI